MKQKKVIGILAAIIFLIGLSYIFYQTSIHARQAAIHEKGSQVMPFDLEKTTHVFQKTETGGLQQVRAKDNNDKEQIALIQKHLREEAESFSKENFDDPATLHGKDMPGLSVLEEAQGKFTVAYTDLPDGGQIIYTTNDEAVLEAFHLWFAAQLHDHGADAMEHM